MTESPATPYLSLCAVLFGILLAFSCLTWGLIYDQTLAVYLLLLLGLMAVSMRHPDALSSMPIIVRHGTCVIAGFGVLLLLQKLLPIPFQHSELWQSIRAEFSDSPPQRFIHNQTDWNLAFGRYLFLALVFCVTVKLAATAQGSKRLLQALFSASILLVAITFLATSTDRVNEVADFRHGLINTNSAATYLGIMLLITLWHLHHQLRRLRPHHKKLHVLEWIDKLSFWQVGQLLLSAFGCLLFLSTLLLTGSKGGIIATLLAAALFLGILIIKKHRRNTIRKPWLILFVGLALTIFIAGIAGPYGLTFRKELNTQGLVLSERPYIYRATLDLIAEHPLLGVGLGNYVAVFPLYRLSEHPHATENIINRAHSTYLEVTAEMGLPGLAVLAFAIYALLSIFIRQLIRRRKHYGFPALGISVMTLVGVHSLVDFPMQIPGIAAITIAVLTLCAIQSEVYQPTESARRQRLRTAQASLKST